MAGDKVQRSIFGVLGELGKVFGEERVMNAAGQVLQTVAQTKATVDDNVATVLSLANLPSRADIEGLRRQLDVVQATVANLSRKLDRLIEEGEDKASPRPRAGARSAGPRRSRPVPPHEDTPG